MLDSSDIPNENIDEYSESGSTLFEPREDVKGDIARSMFYFYTMYSGDADDNFFEGQKEILYDWHQADPITADEIARTWRIADYQDKIPNPFIIDSTLIGRSYFQVDDNNLMGDVSLDGVVNVVDVVHIVAYILGSYSFTSDDQSANADLNNDNLINIIDIVMLVELIINDRLL